MSNRIPMIIDCDPGIDDTFALVYAINQEKFDIKAIHSVAGNVELKYTTRNARFVVKALDADYIPVCEGAKHPLLRKPDYATSVHGETGLGDATVYEEDLAELSKDTAFQSAVKILENAEEPITYVALGPLTNVAILLKARPDLKEKIKEFVIMGGSTVQGNATPYAEFNFYADPHSAYIVMNSGVPIVMAGLNITDFTKITHGDVQEIAKHNESLGRLMNDMYGTYSQEHTQGQDIEPYLTPHDIMPFIYLIHPEMFETVEGRVYVTLDNVTGGMTTLERRARYDGYHNTVVIDSVDNDAYRKHYIEVVKDASVDY